MKVVAEDLSVTVVGNPATFFCLNLYPVSSMRV